MWYLFQLAQKDVSITEYLKNPISSNIQYVITSSISDFPCNVAIYKDETDLRCPGCSSVWIEKRKRSPERNSPHARLFIGRNGLLKECWVKRSIGNGEMQLPAPPANSEKRETVPPTVDLKQPISRWAYQVWSRWWSEISFRTSRITEIHIVSYTHITSTLFSSFWGETLAQYKPCLALNAATQYDGANMGSTNRIPKIRLSIGVSLLCLGSCYVAVHTYCAKFQNFKTNFCSTQPRKKKFNKERKTKRKPNSIKNLFKQMKSECFIGYI